MCVCAFEFTEFALSCVRTVSTVSYSLAAFNAVYLGTQSVKLLCSGGMEWWGRWKLSEISMFPFQPLPFIHRNLLVNVIVGVATGAERVPMHINAVKPVVHTIRKSKCMYRKMSRVSMGILCCC